MGGGGLFNFLDGDWFLNPGTNPTCPAGGFSVWTPPQGMEEVGVAISASYEDMVALDGRNAQADQIFRAARMVLWFVVGPLTMQQEVVTCCYLLHRLLGSQCPLSEALRYQVVDTIDKDFSSFALHM